MDEFERAYNNILPADDTGRFAKRDGEYINPLVQNVYGLWQASAANEREKMVKELTAWLGTAVWTSDDGRSFTFGDDNELARTLKQFADHLEKE